MAAWLALIPWSDVIKAAPAIAKSASELWTSVTNKKPSADKVSDASRPQEATTANSITALELKLIQVETKAGAFEAELDALKNQMLTSSQLIKELADQNTQLISRIDLNRKQMAWLSIAVAVALGLAVVALVLAVAL